MSVERSAGVIFFIEKPEGRYYLVIRSTPSERFPLPREYWDFAKGLLEVGEDGFKAAKREAEEEVGLRYFEVVPGFKEVAQYFTTRDGKRAMKFVAMFLAEARSPKVTLSWEHDQYEWLPYEEAYKKISNSAMKKILEKAHEFLSTKSS